MKLASASIAPAPLIGDRASERRLWWVFAGAVLLLTALIYGPVRHFDFINMDDPLVLKENPWMAQGLQWSSVRWAFSANLTEPSQQAEYWSPLTLLSRLADAQVYGMNPGAFHVTSVLLHLCNALLVAAAFRLLTGHTGRSIVVGLLFLVHPLNVEPVCWLSARKDLLNTTFILATFLAYGWYVRQPSARRYLLVVAAYACCLMAKPMGVSVPFLLLILDAWPLRRWPAGTGARAAWLRLLAEKVPLLALAGGAAGLAIWSQHNWGALPTDGVLPMPLRIENALVSYATYVRRLVWADDLAAYYPHPGQTLTAWQYGGAAAFLVAVTALAFALRRRAPSLLAGWLWFGVSLGPVIGLMQIGAQAMADRYMYLAGLGLLVALVWALADFTLRRWQAAAGALALLLASAGAARQVSFWHDSQTVFTHAVAVTNNNAMAHYSLGCAQAVEGPTRDARAHLRRALQISARIHPAWETLGQVEEKLGHDRPALACYANALKLHPTDQRSLLLKGLLFQKMKSDDNAAATFQRMQELAPADPRPPYLLGKLYEGNAQWSAAAAAWSTYLRIRPNDADVRRRLELAQREE